MLNNNPINQWYGLRFGTVNGFSRNFRSELMLNSMSRSAIDDGVVRMSNSNIHRAILSLSEDRKSTRLNSSHVSESRMPSSA